MRSFKSQEYAVLPRVGMLPYEKFHVGPKNSRRVSPITTLFLSLLLLVSFLGTATAWNPTRFGTDEDLEAIINRATNGDQYLLGVVKADITG